MQLSEITTHEQIEELPGDWLVAKINYLVSMIKVDPKFFKSTMLYVSIDVSTALVMSNELTLEIDIPDDESPMYVGRFHHLKTYVEIDSEGIRFK
jgi:hypothetical protein